MSFTFGGWPATVTVSGLPPHTSHLRCCERTNVIACIWPSNAATAWVMLCPKCPATLP